MSTSFRLLSAADGDELTRALLAWHAADGLALDPFAARREVVRSLGDSHGAHLWLIEHSGQPIGYVMLSFKEAALLQEPKAYVTALYVTPAFRERGIGRQTLRLIDDVGRWLQVRVHHFDTESENKHAHSLYRVRPLPGDPYSTFSYQAIA